MSRMYTNLFNSGWMSARGDLDDEEVKKEYERGYKIVGDWFGKFIDQEG